MSEQPGTERQMLAVDTRHGDLAAQVAAVLDVSAPTLVVCEGLSMYLEEAEALTLLHQVRAICANPESRFWVDFVSADLFTGEDGLPRSVRSFMRGMQVLGEPFVFGTNQPDALLAEANLRCIENTTADALLADVPHDPIFGLYRFCIAGSNEDR